MSWWGRLRRLWAGIEPANDDTVAPAVAVAPSLEVDAAALVVDEAPCDDAPSAGAAPMITDDYDDMPIFPEDFEIIEEPPLDGPLEAQVTALAAMVEAHYHGNPPELVSFPAVASRVLARRQLEFDELLELATVDAAIGAAMLRAVNSAFYHRMSPVNDLHSAIIHIGLREGTQIATSIAARALFDMQERALLQTFRREFHRLFHQSMTAAHAAAWLAERTRAVDSTRAFLAGLFHDVGKSMALRALAQLVLENRVVFGGSEALLPPLLDRVHVHIGLDLHERWSLPEDLTAVCRHHHDDDLGDAPHANLIHIVRVVSGLNLLRLDPARFIGLAPHVRDSLRALGVSREVLMQLHEELRVVSSHISHTYDLKIDAPDKRATHEQKPPSLPPRVHAA